MNFLLLKKSIFFVVLSYLVTYAVSDYIPDFQTFFQSPFYSRTFLLETLTKLKQTIPNSSTSSPWNIEKPEELNSKQRLIERIRDYTVKIESTCSNFTTQEKSFGTGWLLDYELPKDKSYPLKWFIATNAHVISSHKFTNNDYNQTLPTPNQKCLSNHLYLYRWEGDGWVDEILRENKIDFEDPEVWTSSSLKTVYKHYSEPTPYDLDYSLSWWKSRKPDMGLMRTRIADPKLFYVPINYMNGSHGNHFKDFAILEINFRSERVARAMTQKVYDKEPKERINFLSDSSIKKEYYSAGYPGNSYNPYRSFGNYSFAQDKSSDYIDCSMPNRLEAFEWDSKNYNSIGCYHYLLNFKAGPGNSGSMVVDSEGNLLGLHTLGSEERGIGAVEPIRNKKTCFLGFISCQPEYDLINGAVGQRTSYRQQLKQYFPNTVTYLKSKYNW